MDQLPKTLFYKRSHFVTHLPVTYRYSPTHQWIDGEDTDIRRVGFTKFAVRMLGDMVDHGFETGVGNSVEPGEVLGWIEGFKAISDLYCVGRGEFLGGNPVLSTKIHLVNKVPYSEGWIYSIRGEPDDNCVDVWEYQRILDKTIDRILEQQKDPDSD